MVVDDNSFDSLFAEESPEQEVHDSGLRWKILIVDDEEDIHSVIKLSLDNFIFENRKIQFLDAYSGEQAREILMQHDDIALVLLDVVMETDHAGLNFVKFIRETIKNHFIRIVLWTGQPGHAPKKEVVMLYEINDYKTKTDLTDDNIFTAVLSSIRSYNSMMIIEGYRQSLEEKVKERTKTIEEQKNKITDSITYARKIQESLLPSERLIKQYFPESFVFYRPKDIVSGDFYWIACPSTDEKGNRNEKIFIAAADCTGHGIPGAFMSLLGISFLNEIVSRRSLDSTGQILDRLRAKVKKALNQFNDKVEQKDGMDLSMILIDTESKEIQYSGAYNPLIIINKGEMRILKADRQPIGMHIKEIPFTTQTFSYKTGDVLYMYSDGFMDQIGGADEKKYMAKNFRDLLLEISNSPFYQQRELLSERLKQWKNGYEQIDDIIVAGVSLR